MKFTFSLVLLALVALAQTLPAKPRYYMNPGADIIMKQQNWGKQGPYFQGDMMLTEEEAEMRLSNKVAPKAGNDRWPNKTLVYTFVKQFTEEELEIIQYGMGWISSQTCIKFRLAGVDDENYVEIGGGDGCGSPLGMIGGQQPLTLGVGCFDPGTVAHELMHALGFDHEQTRPDRDDYVIFHPENLKDESFLSIYDKYNEEDVDLYYYPYDYSSIMHYGATDFGKVVNGTSLVVLEVKDKTKKIGLNEELSVYDVAMMNRRYKC